jgi:hypothetical protein
MSALGQKQTCAAQNGMSALPPKADMCGATTDVRFGPKADIEDDYVRSGTAPQSACGWVATTVRVTRAALLRAARARRVEVVASVPETTPPHRYWIRVIRAIFIKPVCQVI